MANTLEEKAHWRSVLQAFDDYMRYHLSANQARRNAFAALPKEQREVYDQLGFREKLEAVDEGIRRNAEFIDEMIADPVFRDMIDHSDLHEDSSNHALLHSHENDGLSHRSEQSHTHGESGAEERMLSPTHTHAGPSRLPTRDRLQAESELAQDKVRSTLRSFVRDWAVEGEVERQACYAPCLEALERHFPLSQTPGTVDRADRRVLVPGCGLGRLLLEIVARGFSAQGNEFSTYMLLGSHWVLNQTTSPFSHQIHPYLHSFSNHLTTRNLLRRVYIPDVVPSELLESRSTSIKGNLPDFSLVAGDFEEIYRPDSWAKAASRESEDPRGQWDAVVTCFFLDCARNILSYLRIIYALLAPGGVWINVGPLLWHFENTPASAAQGQGSIELSLDEVKALAQVVGFEIRARLSTPLCKGCARREELSSFKQDERTIKTLYTGVPDSMLRNEYQAAFWTATKRLPQQGNPAAVASQEPK